MKYYRIVTRKGELVFSNFNRRLNNGLDPNYTFMDALQSAIHYRQHGEKVFVKAFNYPTYCI